MNTLYFFENFIQILLDFLLCLRYNSICSQEWWNRQTRRLQVPVVAIPCGFKSHLLHRRDTISDLAYRIFLYLKRCGRYAKLRGSCADSGKWGLCGMKTRSRSVSLAAVLSVQPRSPCSGYPKPVGRVWALRTCRSTFGVGSSRSSHNAARPPQALSTFSINSLGICCV